MAARPQRPDEYAGLVSSDLDDIAERLDQETLRAVGVSCMCPGDAPEIDRQADEHVGGRPRREVVGDVRPWWLTRQNNPLMDVRRPLLESPVPPE